MREPMEHAEFPSSEVLAAFIDGQLDETTRREVMAHIADCDECYATLDAAEAWRKNEKGEAFAAASSHRGWWVATGFLAAAASLAVVFAMPPVRSWYERASYERRLGLRRLVSAANDSEFAPTEARLSGGFSFKRTRATTRGTQTNVPWKVRAAADAVNARVESSNAPGDLHARSVALLYLGDTSNAALAADDALRHETGRTDVLDAVRHSADARLLNDVAAIHYSVWVHDQKANDLLLASEAAERAWTLKRDSEAGWNRALIREEMQLPDAAREAWRDYLAIDSGSEWAVVARQHLDALSQRSSSTSEWPAARRRLDAALQSRDTTAAEAIAREFPQQLRTHIEDERLGDWAAGGENAASKLSAAALAADVVAASSGDRVAADTIARIRQLAPAQQRAAADAIAAYVRGRNASSRHDLEAARVALESAESGLRRLDVPLYRRASVVIATTDYYQGRLDAAHSRFAELLADPIVPSRYPSVAAQASWIAGMIDLTVGHPYEAVSSYQRAAATFDRLHEDENAAFLRMLTAEALQFAGDGNRAWQYYFDALRIANRAAGEKRLALMLGGGARHALSAGYVAAAVLLSDAALHLRISNTDPAFVADALMTKGTALLRLAERLPADACLNRAGAIASQLHDSSQRATMMADIVSCRASANSGDRSILRQLDTAIDAQAQRRDAYRLSRLYFARAMVQSATGQDDAAERDFAAGIATVCRVDAANATAVAGWRQNLRPQFDDAISFAVSHRRPALALSWIHMIRSATPAARGGVRAISSESHSSGREKNRAVAVVWSLPDRTCVWTSGPSTTFAEVRISREQLRAAARAAVRGDRASSEKLYDALIRPAATAGTTAISVVPDEIVGAIPFPALYDAKARQFAIEQFEITVEPAISTTRAHQAESFANAAAVVIADPAFNAALLPELSRLSGAVAEAGAIARDWPGSTILSGERATPSALRAAVPHAAVLHIAAHALADVDARGHAAIALAPERAQSGLLYSADIEALDLSRTTLVVVSTCQSGEAANGGAVAVAQAFASAGVPYVIATTDDLNDAAASRFFSDFYSSLRLTNDPAATLRELQMRDAARDPGGVWRQFFLVHSFSDVS